MLGILPPAGALPASTIATMSINYTRSAPSASPVTRTSLLLGLSFGLHFLALLFVAARITVKWKLKQLGKEDVFIIMAAVCSPSPPSWVWI